MRTALGSTVVLACTLALAACSDPVGPGPGADPGVQPSTRVVPRETLSPTDTGPSRPRVSAVIADGLEVPWGIDFLPDGSALVTERDSARVLLIPPGGEPREVGRVEEASPQGEAGLLGLAVSPDFEDDATVFLYVTTTEDNRIVRTTYDGRLGTFEPILTGIPNGFIHDGGRLEFGPDGFLYVSTGETGEPPLAQDESSPAGKILRITTDGEPAPGNPDETSPIWSLGHRNVQGLAFDDRDRLWASEFGQDTWDEVNLIDAGVNYGWPLVEGRSEDAGLQRRFRNPAVQWPTEVASPSGLAYLDGSLWLAALRGARLWRVPVDARGAGDPTPFFVGEYGRLRTVIAAPDGTLWVTTSNRDGRGDPAEADDRILQVSLG